MAEKSIAWFADEVKESDSIAIKDNLGNKVSYRQLYESARNMEGHMDGRVLTVVLCDNSFQNLELILKLLFLKQPMLLLAGNADAGFLDTVLTNYQPGYLWEKGSLRQLWPGSKITGEMNPELALLLSTSGTVGKPKLARISYQNILEEIRIGINTFRIQGGQKGIRILPVDHVYGLTFCLYHWYVGATIVTTDVPLISTNFDRFYDLEGVCNMAGLPFHYRVLLKKKFFTPERVEGLHCAVTGGAKLDGNMQRVLVSLLRKKIWLCYGQTECTSMVTAISLDDPEAKPGTIGKSLTGVEAYLDQKGELVIKSPTVCMGYAADYRDLKKGDENRCVTATGDLGYIDGDGCIFLVGRIKRFVKILGNRIGLDEIEELMRANFPGLEICCTGENDELNLYYIESPNSTEPFKTLLLRKGGIPLNLVHFYPIRYFPRNSTGKVIYSRLDAMRGREA